MPYISKVTDLTVNNCVTIDKWLHLSEPCLSTFNIRGLDLTTSGRLLHLSLLPFWQQLGILLYEYKENHFTRFSPCHHYSSQEQNLCVGRLKYSLASSFM